ncbi:MAG: ThiF family adenylyltransferase [Gemmatimonadetes bacterium]|nr:ThiF family adenylyltransferase [Gemmatimonadota bacterium]
MTSVTYGELTQRNAGFLAPQEQERLRGAAAFVCGVGGMGGAAVEALARSGVGTLGLADFDRFEATNLNRQVFASAHTLGRLKTEATREALLEINPEMCVHTYGAGWTDHLEEILGSYDVVVNGMDDLRAGIHLYRAARRHGVTVVDAFVSPHPSVTVVRPDDPRPEEWLGFPTRGFPVDALSDEALAGALLCELSFVAAVSGGIGRLDPHVVGEILRGERPRCSFAPVVIISGNLMAFEAIGVLLDRTSGAGYKGYFVDPWTGRIERPGPRPLVALRRWSALRYLKRLAAEVAS